MVTRAVLIAVLVLMAVGNTAIRTPAQARPDIIFLYTDDMRPDDWAMLPETERLVGGVFYPNVVAPTPLCCPERCQLMTGQYAHNTGCKDNGDNGWPAFKPRRADALGPALRAAGYHTAWIGKYLNQSGAGAALGWDDWLGVGQGTYDAPGGYSTDVYRDQAIDVISHTPSPLFLGVSFYAPHNPATPPPRYADADVGPAISDLDRNRKRTLLAVDEAVVAIAGAMGPRWEESCVFVLTDNGFMLGEHGAHGKSIWWDQASRVPMRARCAGLGSGVDTRLVATVDLLPTILRAAGTAAWWPVDGRPLQDPWSRDGVLIESWVLNAGGEERHPWKGIKGVGWVYVEEKDHNPKLFLDPAESDNVYQSLPASEQQRYADWLDALKVCAEATC